MKTTPQQKQQRRHMAKFRKMPYAKYLQTRHWKQRRKMALKAAEFRCEQCYSTDRLEVHHKNYSRPFGERKSDLKVLCHDCHNVEHEDKAFLDNALFREFAAIVG